MEKSNGLLKLFGDVCSYLLIFVLSFVFLINIIFLYKSYTNSEEVPGLFGYKPLIILTDSMKQTFKYGDLIIAKDVSVSELEDGDIIVYKLDDVVIANRIVEIKDDAPNIQFITKSDNNRSLEQEVIDADDVEGKYVKKIPGLGNILLLLNKPFFVVFITIVILVILLFNCNFMQFKFKDDV